VIRKHGIEVAPVTIRIETATVLIIRIAVLAVTAVPALPVLERTSDKLRQTDQITIPLPTEIATIEIAAPERHSPVTGGIITRVIDGIRANGEIRAIDGICAIGEIRVSDEIRAIGEIHVSDENRAIDGIRAIDGNALLLVPLTLALARFSLPSQQPLSPLSPPSLRFPLDLHYFL
jgi:hypothetical protein